jgi:D-cysteine desulfhydrase
MKKNKVSLASLPTPIYKADFLSTYTGASVYIKRDDYTGTEISGNKIRKLEYVFREVLDGGYNSVITTGGIQSNHCRATAAAAVSLGLKPVLLLKKNDDISKFDGNYLLDRLFGAEIYYCTEKEYSESRDDIMKDIALSLKKKRGLDCYVIPEGASFGPGSLGYFEAMEEIVNQEKEMGVDFDVIAVATGSGGTYSGLYLANKYYNLNKKILGFAVCDSSEHFVNYIDKINKETLSLLDKPLDISKDDINIIDSYKGIGYAKSTNEELDFIFYIASNQGLILDPVYTAKAVYGMCNEIKAGKLIAGNILYIHTGGIFGLFPKFEQFGF